MRADLVVILGPTASGKTAAAVEVAREIGGEIISADSMQVYSGLDIGTAKPTEGERQGIRFHGIDVVELDEEFTVVDFQRLAERSVAEVRSRGGVPIICGGTGFYIRAYLEGFAIPEVRATPALRQRLRREVAARGAPALHRRLAEADPTAAARIQPNDVFRIVRALEVLEVTGRPMSELQGRSPIALPFVRFGIRWPREALYRRIGERTDRMLAAGWLQETRDLLSKGYAEGRIGSKALGYGRLLAHLRGQTSLAEAAALIKRDTRRYAKRQMTWFRKEPNVHWIDAEAGVASVLERMLRLLHS
jgi:tRNA dimethylallyltransferase